MKIILIGFRATGKTTVGRLLAKRLGVPFLDVDQYLEEKEGQTIAEMVAKKGWPYFRTLEKKALRELAALKEGVLALGGGAVMHEEEMALLRQNACVVWLKAPPALILKRLKRDEKTASQRPALTDMALAAEIENLLEKREPLYRRFADWEVETAGLTPEEIISRLKAKLRELRCFPGRRGR